MGKIQAITPDTFLKRTGKNNVRVATYSDLMLKAYELQSPFTDYKYTMCLIEQSFSKDFHMFEAAVFRFRNTGALAEEKVYCSVYYGPFLIDEDNNDVDIAYMEENMTPFYTFMSKKELNEWFCETIRRCKPVASL